MENKKVLIEIENVRVVRWDTQNLAILRLEEVFYPKDKVYINSWQFKGYYSTFRSALKAIVTKELLIDKNNSMALNDHLKQVERIYNLIEKKIEEEVNK